LPCRARAGPLRSSIGACTNCCAGSASVCCWCIPPAKRGQVVEAVLDPLPYAPRRNKRRIGRLLGEFARRSGDPNAGGSTGRVKLVTAYRQEALRLASVLQARGAQKPAVLRADAEAPNAGRILRDDVYGWFERVERGIYALTPAGVQALTAYVGRFAAPACLTTDV
jgi:hypothetical protein